MDVYGLGMIIQGISLNFLGWKGYLLKVLENSKHTREEVSTGNNLFIQAARLLETLVLV